MLVAVNDFYKETKFHEWFISTHPEQEQAIASFKSICNFDYTWLDSFYGRNDKISSRIIISFIAGHFGWGGSLMRKDGILVLSPVLGHVYQNGGKVIYNNDIRNLVHEFSHPFCNPLIDAHWISIARKVNEVFYKVSDILASNSYYNAYSLITESFVRACVIRYMMSHDQEYIYSPSQTLAIEESRGFLFVRPIVKALEKRENAQGIDRVYYFLNDAVTYYLATVDGTKPRVRPFGTILLFDGKLYIMTEKAKEVYQQIKANPFVEICTSMSGVWLRVEAELVEDDNRDVKVAMLNKLPALKAMYSPDDDNIQTFYLKDATATFSSFVTEPEVITF
jgi:uncharacterized pyridoxamine 5'-phosphate oxidase family protein